MKTMTMMATSVPMVPIRLCNVAASSATAKQMSANSGQKFPEVAPHIGVRAEDRAGEQIDHQSGNYRVAEQRGWLSPAGEASPRARAHTRARGGRGKIEAIVPLLTPERSNAALGAHASNPPRP